MNSKTPLSFLFTIIIAILLVAIYQLPTVENISNKYNFIITINDYFPYSRMWQQNLEDYKITFSSYFDKKIIKNANKTIHKSDIPKKINLLPETPVLIITPVDIKKSCIENCTVLMLGDSVMGDVSFALERLLKKEQPTWEVIDAHKVSSGLSNQNYYNWPATAKKLLEKHQPDYTFILIGTNDAQGFSSNGKGHAFGKDDWKNEYNNRVIELTTLFKNNGNDWSWIELPSVKDNGFNKKLQIIRDIQEDNSKEHFIETQIIFGKTDHSDIFNMKIRAGDGIHLNAKGANLLGLQIYDKIKENLK